MVPPTLPLVTAPLVLRVRDVRGTLMNVLRPLLVLMALLVSISTMATSVPVLQDTMALSVRITSTNVLQ